MTEHNGRSLNARSQSKTTWAARSAHNGDYHNDAVVALFVLLALYYGTRHNFMISLVVPLPSMLLLTHLMECVPLLARNTPRRL